MRIEQQLDTPVNFRLNKAFGTVELEIRDKFDDQIYVVMDIESACFLSEIMDNGPSIPRPRPKKPWWAFWRTS